jgi:hypothetical protein
MLAVRAGDHLARRLLEHPDELAADDLALLLGIGDAGERIEEPLPGIDHLQLRAGRGDEVALDLLGLAGPEQPVVDEHAGQPVADRALHQRRGDRRVHAARQPADRLPATDLPTNRGSTCSSITFSVVQDGTHPATS